MTTTHTLSLGPLSLLASQTGPLLTITIHAPSDSAPVGKMTLTVAEWTSLVALVDCMGAADKRHAEDRAEIKRLNNLRDIDYIASKQLRHEALAENDSLRQQVHELTEERDAYRHAARLAHGSANLYDLLGEELEQIVGGDGTSLERLRRLESERSQARSDLSAALVSVDAMAERIEQMRPVYESAVEWRKCHERRWKDTQRRSPDPMYVFLPDDVQQLSDAIDTALAHTAKETSKP